MSLLTVPEVAKLLRISRAKAFDMARRNEIPTVRMGRSVRVPAESLDEWVKARTTKPKEQEPKPAEAR